MKTLLLVTNGFPYGTSEQSFLQTEYDELRKHFKIIVLSRKITDESRQKGYEDINAIRFEEKRDNKLLPKTCMCTKLHSELNRVFSSSLSKKLKLQAVKECVSYANHAMTIIPRLEALIDSSHIDIIYTYWCTPVTLAAIWLKEKYPSLKVVSRFHGHDLYNERTNCGWQPFRYDIGKASDALFFVCKAGKQYFSEQWHHEGIVAYLGTKENNRISRDETHFVLVSCSNLIKLKRVELIIEGLSCVRDDVIIDWHHFGDGEERARLEKLAQQKLDGKKNLTFHFAGFVRNDLMISLYGALRPSLFITTSSTEGGPVSLQEALSMGIPCIGTDVGGIPDTIADGRNGFLLTANPSPNEIANAIEKYYDLDTEEKNRLCDGAYRMWKENFDAKKNAIKFCHVLDTLTDNNVEAV